MCTAHQHPCKVKPPKGWRIKNLRQQPSIVRRELGDVGEELSLLEYLAVMFSHNF